MKLLKSIAMAAMGAVISASAAMADYPEKPVKFVVPWPPGDLEDVLTRMIADRMQEKFGVSAAVLNKPGGGGGPFPGAVEVAVAPADGYTVGSFVLGVPIVGPRIGIPPLEGNPFEPVGIFLTYPFVVAAGADAPYDDWAGLVEHARSNKVALGHFGAPAIPTQVTMVLAKTSGFSFGSDAAFDALDCNTLASGDADVINTTLQLVLPCINDIKILTSFTSKRISLTPDVPTQTEINPEITMGNWNGLFVHKDTPQEVRDVLAEVAKEVVLSDAAQEIAASTGAEIYWKGAEESQKVIDRDTAQYDFITGLLE